MYRRILLSHEHIVAHWSERLANNTKIPCSTCAAGVDVDVDPVAKIRGRDKHMLTSVVAWSASAMIVMMKSCGQGKCNNLQLKYWWFTHHK